MAINKENNPWVFIIITLILTVGYNYLQRKNIIKNTKSEPAKEKVLDLYPLK